MQTAVFPHFSGDFLSYSDRHEQYWSGYYTSRPHLKTLLRSASAALRALEMTAASVSLLSTSPQAQEDSPERVLWEKMQRGIEGCMRETGLLQHHDAVTGTARREVVKDYAVRLRTCIDSAHTLMRLAFDQLLLRCPEVITSDFFVLLACAFFPFHFTLCFIR